MNLLLKEQDYAQEIRRINRNRVVWFLFIFILFFCMGWPTLTRLQRHSFPHAQSPHEVFKEATVGTHISISFHFLWHMYLPMGHRKRGEYCNIRALELRADE